MTSIQHSLDQLKLNWDFYIEQKQTLLREESTNGDYYINILNLGVT